MDAVLQQLNTQLRTLNLSQHTVTNTRQLHSDNELSQRIILILDAVLYQLSHTSYTHLQQNHNNHSTPYVLQLYINELSNLLQISLNHINATKISSADLTHTVLLLQIVDALLHTIQQVQPSKLHSATETNSHTTPTDGFNHTLNDDTHDVHVKSAATESKEIDSDSDYAAISNTADNEQYNSENQLETDLQRLEQFLHQAKSLYTTDNHSTHSRSEQSTPANNITQHNKSQIRRPTTSRGTRNKSLNAHQHQSRHRPNTSDQTRKPRTVVPVNDTGIKLLNRLTDMAANIKPAVSHSNRSDKPHIIQSSNNQSIADVRRHHHKQYQNLLRLINQDPTLDTSQSALIAELERGIIKRELAGSQQVSRAIQAVMSLKSNNTRTDRDIAAMYKDELRHLKHALELQQQHTNSQYEKQLLQIKEAVSHHVTAEQAASSEAKRLIRELQRDIKQARIQAIEKVRAINSTDTFAYQQFRDSGRIRLQQPSEYIAPTK